MKNRIRQVLIPAGMLLLIIISMTQVITNSKRSVDRFYTVSIDPAGNTLAAWYDEKDITIALIKKDGVIGKKTKLPLEKGNTTYSVVDACIDENKRVYVLIDSLDSASGAFIKEELYVYNFGGLWVSKVVIPVEELMYQSSDIEEGSTYEESWHYGWVNTSGNVLSMIGVNGDETRAVRKVLEFGDNKIMNLKSERFYPLAEGEGIYQAVGNGTDIAYISDSGKVFRAGELAVQEVYPAREVEVLMYPLYLAYAETGYVFMQDGESGDIVKLSLSDGTETLIMKGNGAFSTAEVVTPRDICMMSMRGIHNFSAIIKNDVIGGYQILRVEEGACYLIKELRFPVITNILRFFQYFISYLFVLAAGVSLIYGIYIGITKGRTIMSKLMLTSFPLLVLAMSVFGVVAYGYYKDAVISSYEKQTMDEGNMMTALFGQESFNALEYPYDYTGDDYTYLKKQMESRELYSRVIYYEDGELYTGVDRNAPCFYPIGIQMNAELDRLYQKAALTGRAETATIQDRIGRRIVSVTPVGGSSGRSVYLYEAGVSLSVIEGYQSSYIRNFVWICIAFVIVVVILLTAMFLQILQPLAEIRTGMELFTRGERDIRIEPETQDELAGICQAFNKMADDIDMQIVNLQNMSDTYYRFIPLSIIGILGKDNLSNLTLGAQIQGTYAVLYVFLGNTQGEEGFAARERKINKFFNLINSQATKGNAIPIVDDANLSDMSIICKDGTASAIMMALAILARVDAHNASGEEELDIRFLLHYAETFVGICGDEERYVPVMINPEMERILEERKEFMKVGARLVVTKQAYEQLSGEEVFENRYIGHLGREEEIGFYEFYDDRDAKEAHLLKVTNSNFRKAMIFFEKGRLYEARNLFAMVLQDNPQDKVAKYYIFRCE